MPIHRWIPPWPFVVAICARYGSTKYRSLNKSTRRLPDLSICRCGAGWEDEFADRERTRREDERDRKEGK